jgi:hypothetical protein
MKKETGYIITKNCTQQKHFTLKVMPFATILLGDEVKVALVSVLSCAL